MTKTELMQWAQGIFWPAYRNLCATPFATKWKGGERGEAIKKVVTLDPSAELRERIMSAISAQITHRKQLLQTLGSMQAYIEHTKFNKLYCNRSGAVWLNQMGWEDEIPSIAEQRADAAASGATCRHCSTPVHGPRFDVCTYHMSIGPDGRLHGGSADLLREYYRQHPEIKGLKGADAIKWIREKMPGIAL